MSSQQTILVIDDDADVRWTLREGLEWLGLHVLEAESGVGCAEYFHQHKVSAVICDIFMPHKEGIATISEIKEANPEVPVIAISGGNPNPEFDILRIAQIVGADRSLKKPFRLDQLRRALVECGVTIPR
jgi:CheY-like chemotaxis protein